MEGDGGVIFLFVRRTRGGNASSAFSSEIKLRLREVLFCRGEVEEARALGNWLQQRSSRKRKRKTEEDLQQGKRRRDRRIANRTGTGDACRQIQQENEHQNASVQQNTRIRQLEES